MVASIREALEEGAVSSLTSQVLAVQNAGRHTQAFNRDRPTQVDDSARLASTAFSEELEHASTVEFHAADKMAMAIVNPPSAAAESKPARDDFASKIKTGPKSNGPSWSV